MSKIKVCHITSAHYYKDVRIFEKQCSSLANAGFDVKLIVAKGESTTINGVEVIKVQSSEGNRFKRMWKTAKLVYLSAQEQQAKLYHFHDPELLRFALRLKKSGAKVIYDAHEDLPRQIMGKYWIPKPLRKIVSFLVEKFENYIVSKLDGVVAATGFIKDRFLKVNPNCIDVNNYPILSEEIAVESSQENSICYAGGITDNRGIAGIVESLAFLPGVKLKLAGSYSPQNFRDELSALSSWNQVEELGFVSRYEVKKLMRQSIAGLVTLKPLPNYLDSLPIKMFEYMYERVPVIASDFPLWKTIVEEQGCGICVDPNSPKEIANGIQYLIDNPTVGQEMGKKGRALVLEKYNWKNEEVKLVDFYKTVLE